MAKTPSNMLPLGTVAPDFALPDAVSEQVLHLSDFSSDKGLLVMFICNHCPFVKHVNSELSALAREYMAKGLDVVAISSNDVENYPDDSPEKMKETALSENYPFPYLYDELQQVAKAYDAACTPDYYLFDGEKKLVYRGQLDGARPGNDTPVTGKDLRAAIDALLAGNAISSDQKPSLGCNIKWKNVA